MASRNYGIDYVILGIILLGALAYEFHHYQIMMLLFEENCVDAVGQIVWNEECAYLADDLDLMVTVMVLLGAGAAIMILIGINKMRDSGTYFDDDDDDDSGWPWWVVIAVPIGLVVVGTAFMIITEG